MIKSTSMSVLSAVLKAHAEGASSVVAGGNLEAFELAAAGLFGTRYAVATNNGTNAILASLEALQLRRGSRILVPAYGFYAMLAPLRFYGLETVFVPFSLEALYSRPSDYELALALGPAAMMTFYPWGNIGPADQLYAWARTQSLPVIADLSHSHGAQFANRGIGAYSTISAASFGRGKLISGGELGACATDDPEIANRIVAFGHPNRPRLSLPEDPCFAGQQVAYSYGPKLRPHGLSLAIALSQFDDFAQRMKARNCIAVEMENMARDSGLFEPLKTQEGASRQHWRVVLRSVNKVTEEMRLTLTQYGFPSDNVGYTELLSDHPIAHRHGPHVNRSALSDEWLREARNLIQHLLYLKVPDAGTPWNLAWQKALDKLQQTT